MSDADAKADVQSTNAAAQTAASQASQSDNTTGAQQVRSSGFEGSHKQSTDVNTEEAISTYNGFAIQRALKNQDVLDNLTHQMLQNAIETANMVSKQAVRHSDLAIDRQWNVNETDAFATILAERVAARLSEDK